MDNEPMENTGDCEGTAEGLQVEQPPTDEKTQVRRRE